MTGKARLLYRLLLRLLPPRFRRDFGAEREAVLVERLRDAPGSGARAWVWLIAVVDVFTCAPAEWARALSHQRTRNAPRSNGMDHLKLDLRFALRSLARRPGFAAIAIVTLALGIGANTAIFSVGNGVLLRPLPYLEPGRLVMVWEPDLEDQASPAAWRAAGSMSEPGIDDVRELDAVGAIEGFTLSTVTLNRTGAPELMRAAWVTGGLLDMFGLRPALGRDLTSEDALVSDSATRAVVIGYDLWQTEFGGRSDVIGTTIELSERSYEVVGVAPAGFRFPIGGSFGPEGVQLWRADRREPVNSSGRWRGLYQYKSIARLAAGVSLRSDAHSGEQPREGWSRGVLLTVEIAMSLVLLVGAGLLTRSLVKLYEVDLGFDGREVVRFELSLPSARYDSLATVASFYRTLEERISALPDVEAVGSADYPPLTSVYATRDLRFDRQPAPEPGEEVVVWPRPVTPGYFDAMRLPLLHGRAIEPTDREGSIPVAAVNEAFVREALGGEDPIGKRFSAGSPMLTVVGVVGDVRRSLKAEPEPAVYIAA